ncbi:somatostatin receptor type 5-like [Montipora foliosa]|uniref:somatostatin receptor type 5-like n=1 Tax=Montipora foliosa TaxID=591990 RepID=UPI0035F1166D
MNESLSSLTKALFNCASLRFPDSEHDRKAYQQFCQCTIPPESWHSLVEVILSKLLLVISIWGNVLVIFVLQRLKRNGDQMGAMKLLIQNLCVADMSVCIMYNVSEVVGVDSIYTTIPVCKLVAGMLWTTLATSSCLICCVSAERYLATVKPFDFSIDTRKTVLMVVFSWYYSLTFSIPDFYFITKVEVPYCGRGIVPLCSYDFLRGTDVTITLLTTLSATFLVPIIFIVCVNIAVVKTLSRSQGSNLFRKLRPKADRKRRGVVFIVLLLTAIFVVCSLPFATHLLCNALNVRIPREVTAVAYYLMLVNSTANAFVYSFFSAEFRKTCKEMFSSRLNALRNLLK